MPITLATISKFQLDLSSILLALYNFYIAPDYNNINPHECISWQLITSCISAFFSTNMPKQRPAWDLYFPFPFWECSCPHVFYGLFLFIFKVSINIDVLRTLCPAQSFFIALGVQDNLAYFLFAYCLS